MSSEPDRIRLLEAVSKVHVANLARFGCQDTLIAHSNAISDAGLEGASAPATLKALEEHLRNHAALKEAEYALEQAKEELRVLSDEVFSKGVE